MSEITLTTPVKRKLSLDEAFINTPSPNKKTRREFNTPFKLKIIAPAKETSNREQVCHCHICDLSNKFITDRLK